MRSFCCDAALPYQTVCIYACRSLEGHTLYIYLLKSKNLTSRKGRMPRSKQNTLPSKPSVPASMPKPLYAPPPKIWHSAPAADTTLYSSVKQGLGFGVGSEIGHSLFRSIFSVPPPTRQESEPAAKKTLTVMYDQCLEVYPQNPDICAPLLSLDQQHQR